MIEYSLWNHSTYTVKDVSLISSLELEDCVSKEVYSEMAIHLMWHLHVDAVLHQASLGLLSWQQIPRKLTLHKISKRPMVQSP